MQAVIHVNRGSLYSYCSSCRVRGGSREREVLHCKNIWVILILSSLSKLQFFATETTMERLKQPKCFLYCTEHILPHKHYLSSSMIHHSVSLITGFVWITVHEEKNFNPVLCNAKSLVSSMTLYRQHQRLIFSTDYLHNIPSLLPCFVSFFIATFCQHCNSYSYCDAKIRTTATNIPSRIATVLKYVVQSQELKVALSLVDEAVKRGLESMI